MEQTMPPTPEMAMSSDLFETVTYLTGDGLCLCEMITDASGKPVDYRFLEVNALFEEYTGLKNAKGRTALELVPGLERHWIEAYGRVGLGRESLRFENGSDVMGRWFEVNATPTEPHGCLMILFRDVSARKAAEAEREAALDQSKRLFSELNHRVKNSLAVVQSIIAMEARMAPEEVRTTFDRLSARVMAIGKLYEAMSLAGSIERVEARPYLTGIVAGLRETLFDDSRIHISSEFADVTLPGQQAISLGLILNELIANSIKHAFAPESMGQITATLEKEADLIRFTVSDTGRGMAAGTSPSTGLGGKLVAAFVQDIGGTLDRESSDAGTRTVVSFRLD